MVDAPCLSSYLLDSVEQKSTSELVSRNIPCAPLKKDAQD